MNRNRDYLPPKERNLQERMEGSGSIEEGLASKVEATRRNAPYRTYIDEDGNEDVTKKYGGMLDIFF